MERFGETPEEKVMIDRKALIEILRQSGEFEHMTAGGRGGQGMQHRKTGRALRVSLGKLLENLPTEYRERAQSELGAPGVDPSDIILRWQQRSGREVAQKEEELLRRAGEEIAASLVFREPRYRTAAPTYIKEQVRRAKAERLAEKKHISKKKQERRYRPNFRD